jgi:hypothetical protein
MTYVHPEVLQAYSEGVLLEALPLSQSRRRFSSVSLHPDERAVLRFLRTRYATANQRLELQLKASLKKQRPARSRSVTLARGSRKANLLSLRRHSRAFHC